jgi:glycosyltransferase involved in cell wall biosynthesis
VAGVERVTERTAHALLANGHEVTVLSRRASPAPPVPRAERVRHQDGLDVVLVAGGAGTPKGPFPGHQEQLEHIFERLLLELLPDVILISHLALHSPQYVAIAHRWGIPVAMELHDFYAVCERAHLDRPSGELCDGPDGGRACAQHCFAHQPDAAGRWSLRTHLFDLALAQADALICPSQFVANYFRDRGLDDGRLQVIPNGIPYADRPPLADSARTPRRPGHPLQLASLGVVTPHKGAHIVVDALRKARLAAARYTLFGALTQPYARQLRESAQQSDGVQLRTYGVYDPHLLPTLLADIDAVIIPSLVWETFSIVAREAMACGVPVIASRLGALPEAVREGENGLLFTPGASGELAWILQRIEGDRSLLARLRSGIERSDWITVAERTRRLEGALQALCSEGVSSQRTRAVAPDVAALRTLLTADR